MSGWVKVVGDAAASLERELQNEVSRGHVLHGRVLRAVARRHDRDDVAFEVDGTRLCIVHLTWKSETDPSWPHATFVETLAEDDDE